MARLSLPCSLSVLLLVCGCGSESSPSDSATGGPDLGRDVAADIACAPGTLHCACAAGSTCSGGLVCVSNACVEQVGSGGSTGSGGNTGAGGTSSSGGAGGFAGATSQTQDGGTTHAEVGPAPADAGVEARIDSSGPPLDGSLQADGPPPTKLDGGATGLDANAAETGTGLDGGSGNAVTCLAVTTGCLCGQNLGPAPGLSSCSKDSVTNGAPEGGRCCRSGDSCTCESLGCAIRALTGSCSCDYTIAFESTTSWTKVDDCPAPEADSKCCFDAVASYCSCGRSACPSGATEVANCSLAQLTACKSGETAVESCR